MANNFGCLFGNLAILMAILSVSQVDGFASVCKRKTFLQKIRFTCPEPGQPSDMIYCCGDDDDIGGQYCCRGLLDDKTIESFARNIGSIIATIAGIIGFIIILLIICCCVCPCCLLYKRRNGGTVYRSTGSNGVNMTVVPAPGPTLEAPPVGFSQSTFPAPQPYPQAANPPYPQGPYPTQPSYPIQPAPGYPVQSAGGFADQPPPYGAVTYQHAYHPPQAPMHDVYQKQSAYNPSFQ